jgi:hypothetical protein
VAVVQYTFTQTVHRIQRTEHKKQLKRKKIGKCGPCPVFASYNLAFALQLRKKQGKTSVRVVEKCPDIPVAFLRQYASNTLDNEQATYAQQILVTQAASC